MFVEHLQLADFRSYVGVDVALGCGDGVDVGVGVGVGDGVGLGCGVGVVVRCTGVVPPVLVAGSGRTRK